MTAWFKGRDTDPATQAALRDVNEIESTHALFRQRVDQILGRDRPRRRVTTEEELREQLQDLNPEPLQDSSTIEPDTPGRSPSHRTFNRRRSNSRKLGAQLQQFFKDFTDFVDVYGGIISLVRNAGVPYGEAAYETLSLLLVVVVHKSGNDEMMGDLMCGLTAAFPRLDLLMSIQPSSALEKYVAAVYVDVIIFARTAADYLANLKAKVLNALVKTSSIGIEKSASTIKGKLAQVNSEAMVLLHVENQQTLENVKRLEGDNQQLINKVADLQHNISVLKDDNTQLESELQTVKDNNERLESQKDKFQVRVERQANVEKEDQLLDLKDALNLQGGMQQWPDIKADALYDILSKIFPRIFESSDPGFRHKKSSADSYLQMTRKIILRDADFISWYQSSHSSLLFLCGRTRREGRTNIRSTSSWLSPAPVFAARKIRSDIEACRSGNLPDSQPPLPSNASIMSTSTTAPYSKPVPTTDMSSDLCIFCTCHPGVSSPETPDHDSTRPFSILACHIYAWRKGPLSSTSDLVSRAQAITQKKVESKRAAVGDLTSLLIELLEDRTDVPASATVWILLDRLDRCDLELSRIMDQLTRLVTSKGNGPRVKIMAVAAWPYEGARWNKSDLERGAEGRVIFKDEWDQKNKDWTGLAWSRVY